MQNLRDFLERPVEVVARELLGSRLEREIDGELVIVKIVETEAYHQTDAASHSYKGKTARTEVMFGPAGHLYVYFTYGMHYCCNIVTGRAGEGSAVLIRAVQPLQGESILMTNRPNMTGPALTNGPAKLCQALSIDNSMNGHDLSKIPLRLQLETPLPEAKIILTKRIGISKAKDMPLRHYIRGNPYVSRL